MDGPDKEMYWEAQFIVEVIAASDTERYNTLVARYKKTPQR